MSPFLGHSQKRCFNVSLWCPHLLHTRNLGSAANLVAFHTVWATNDSGAAMNLGPIMLYLGPIVCGCLALVLKNTIRIPTTSTFIPKNVCGSSGVRFYLKFEPQAFLFQKTSVAAVACVSVHSSNYKQSYSKIGLWLLWRSFLKTHSEFRPQAHLIPKHVSGCSGVRFRS